MRLMILVAAASAISLIGGAALAAPSVSLSAKSGHPGVSLTVAGGGFDPNTRVDVFFDTTDVAFAVSNGSGSVTMPVTIPASAQPGQHWITLDEAKTYAAAQASFLVNVNWTQDGWGPTERGFNPYENTVNASNASQLTEAWAVNVTPYGNPKPTLAYSQWLYVFDENEVLHAYSGTGEPMWTAVPGTTFRFSQATLAAANGLIFIGDANGRVAAYKSKCRTDGGTCTAQWSRNIGTEVDGGLTVSGDTLYAPGADGLVHVFTASSGTKGTSITPFWSGAVTQAAPVEAGGLVYIVQGDAITEIGPGGVLGGEALGSGASISRPTIGNGTAYFTATDGYLYSLTGVAVSIGATGCNIAPAFAGGVVYAASCNSVGAYDANTGATHWTIAATEPMGISVANGVVFVCDDFRLYMYASYGSYIGNGGWCRSAPVIVNGTLYNSGNGQLSASTLTGESNALRFFPRPDVHQLKPNPKLHTVAP